MSANSGRVGYPVPITVEVVGAKDPSGNVRALTVDVDGNLNVSGGGGGGGAVTIADGADVTQGAIADAAVGDAAGTVNAHERFIAKVAADEWDSVNHAQKVLVQNALLPVASGVFALPTCQYVGQVDTSATVVTFTGRLVNSGGTIVWVVAITYSDSTRQTPLSFARTT